MISSVNDWLTFLRFSDTVIGIPFVVAGIALMMFGWRLWRVCVMVSFAVIGTAVGTHVAVLVGASQNERILYSVGCAALLGICSYWPAKYALAVLGGLIGAGLLAQLTSSFKIHGNTQWLLLMMAFLGSSGYALINRQLVVVFVTAFLGAALALSGFTIFLMEFPSLYGTLRNLAAGSAVVGPFILLVPWTMSSFYQVAEVRRNGKEL